MSSKPFEHPVAVLIDGRKIVVASASQAESLLSSDWPKERGPRAEDALATCLKVMEGYRSTVDAEVAFRDAAREAGILADG
jgi:hypothetical protein